MALCVKTGSGCADLAEPTAGSLHADSLNGDGYSITNLNATNIMHGALDIARLPNNIPLSKLENGGGNPDASALTMGTLNIARLPEEIPLSKLQNEGIRGTNHVLNGVDVFIGGGTDNQTDYNYSAVVGGSYNVASSDNSFVGGGSGNTASASYAFVGAGETNTSSGTRSAVVGGKLNTASAGYSFVGGGDHNQSSGTFSAVLGGSYNVAAASQSVISGGILNQANGNGSSITGGESNFTGTMATNSAIAGGSYLELYGSGSFGFRGGNPSAAESIYHDNMAAFVDVSLCVKTGSGCDSLATPTAGTIYANIASINGADYAEYFLAEEPMQKGDVAGLNKNSGKLRKYRTGDFLVGIVSTAPGITGNDKIASRPDSVLIALVGQVPVQNTQTKRDGRQVLTLDGQKIGLLLDTGDVFLQISGTQNQEIKALNQELEETKKALETMQKQIQHLLQQK